MSIASFLGAKALKGTSKQKSWANSIRDNKLSELKTSVEDVEKLLNVGGVTETAAFWISNKDVSAKEFTAENIVKWYRGFYELESKHWETLARTNPQPTINACKKEILDYVERCPFNLAFESRYRWLSEKW